MSKMINFLLFIIIIVVAPIIFCNQGWGRAGCYIELLLIANLFTILVGLQTVEVLSLIKNLNLL